MEARPVLTTTSCLVICLCVGHAILKFLLSFLGKSAIKTNIAHIKEVDEPAILYNLAHTFSKKAVLMHLFLNAELQRQL